MLSSHRLRRTPVVFALLPLLGACALAKARSPSAGGKEAVIELAPDIELRLKMILFEPDNHAITECRILDWTGICLVDGAPVFGTDWEMPRTQLAEARVRLPSCTVPLDVSSMYNPWSGDADPRFFCAEEIEGGYAIHGSFSDAAGGYVAEWLVIQCSALRTVLSSDEHLIASWCAPTGE